MRKDFFPIIDEANHEASRSLGAMFGAYATLVAVGALVYFDLLPLPKIPIMATFAAFAASMGVATFWAKRSGVRSRAYRVWNHLESFSLLVGLAVSLKLGNVLSPLIWAFYIIMTVIHAQVTGVSLGGFLVISMPLVGLAVSGIGDFGTVEWQAVAAGGTLTASIYLFYGMARERQYLALARQVETEERLTRIELELLGERKLRKAERQWLDTLQMTAATILMLDGESRVTSVAGSEDADVEYWQSIVDAAGFNLSGLHDGDGPLSVYGLRTPDGQFVDLRVVPLPTTATPGACAVLVQEVTERIRLEEEHKKLSEQMLVSEKMASLGVLSAGIAHEINNPLTYVSGNLEYLIDYGVNVPGSEAVLEDIREGMIQIQRIVGDLKLFAHSGRGESCLFDLRDVFHRTERMVGAHFKQTATLHLSVGDEPVIVSGRPERIQQVLMNLLVNANQALEHSDRTESRIDMELRREADEAVLVVQDNGEGIPEDLLRKVFEPFYTTKPPGEGTGMGLSISYQIVQEHGGRMEGRNREEGGAQFIVRLPLAEEKIVEETA